ncbi:type VI secretion protein [Streptomyces sp. HNM0663]|uniref:Type VI secretion protein n=1 Tax=Streptomyces chengmaiensis TaxID=3040919 RepID=A0ABT6HVM7_9ACTN|nr:type VI secretion protein [Streptomyces chengmaiensis]MDH2392757.1 type VI secretion protein [Streptomyces chengmaiensis]
MPDRHDEYEARRAGYARPGERGIPDGLLVGLLAFLLGLTLLVWTATGLAGLFAHGAWPSGVAFTRTPLAMRALASDPRDLPGAWPDTPPEQLSGYGLFWGLAVGELMVLVVLSVFVLGTAARWRAVRQAKKRKMYEREVTGAHGAYEADPAAKPAAGPAAGPAAKPVPKSAAEPVTGTALESPSEVASEVAPAGASNSAAPPSATATPSDRPPDGATADPPGPVQADEPGPAGQHRQPAGSAGQVTPAPLPTVPGPRTPRVLYGGPATRRPATVQAVLDADGPALVVTSDTTVWSETKDARSKLGPVLVYDPGHLCDTPARLHWSPTAHCGDADTAAARAAALLAPVRPHARLDAAMADTAQTLLRCWLHAAAVDGRPFKQVHRWAQGGGAQEAVRILRTHPKAAAGLAGLLESALIAHPERRDVAQQLTNRALSALSSVHIRDACTGNRSDSLSLESFTNEGGTLYVVGEPIEDPRTHPGAMPLLTALASSVVEHGRRMAARSSAGRLDPPLTLILDDVAAVAPLPHLPELLTSGQDQGLPTLVLLRSAEQARARWPEPLPQ